jgi:hypothetical protein
MVVRLAERRVDVPYGLSLGTLGEILSAIAQRKGAWSGFFFHVNLGDVGLLDVGYVAIPIELTLGTHTPGINEYPVTIHAASHPKAFPALKGYIGTDMAAGNASILWLGGTYDVPMGGLGALIDAGPAHGVAQRCLQNFVDDLAEALRARVEQREAELVRYKHFTHGP